MIKKGCFESEIISRISQYVDCVEKIRTLAQIFERAMPRKKVKKIQFAEITFKLSKQQRRALSLFCKHHGTTPIKLIKRSIARYTTYVPEKNAKPYVHPRQLDIWDVIDKQE